MNIWFWVWLIQTYVTGLLSTLWLMIALAKADGCNLGDIGVFIFLGCIMWPVGLPIAIICAINMALSNK